MYRPMDGWTNGWTMFLFNINAMDAIENYDLPTDFAIFTKVLWTDRQTNGPLDRWTDIPTYENVI